MLGNFFLFSCLRPCRRRDRENNDRFSCWFPATFIQGVFAGILPATLIFPVIRWHHWHRYVLSSLQPLGSFLSILPLKQQRASFTWAVDIFVLAVYRSPRPPVIVFFPAKADRTTLRWKSRKHDAL